MEHAAPSEDSALDAKGLADLSEDDWQDYAGAALDKHLGDNSNRINSLHT